MEEHEEAVVQPPEAPGSLAESSLQAMAKEHDKVVGGIRQDVEKYKAANGGRLTSEQASEIRQRMEAATALHDQLKLERELSVMGDAIATFELASRDESDDAFPITLDLGAVGSNAGDAAGAHDLNRQYGSAFTAYLKRGSRQALEAGGTLQRKMLRRRAIKESWSGKQWAASTTATDQGFGMALPRARALPIARALDARGSVFQVPFSRSFEVDFAPVEKRLLNDSPMRGRYRGEASAAETSTPPSVTKQVIDFRSCGSDVFLLTPEELMRLTEAGFFEELFEFAPDRIYRRRADGLMTGAFLLDSMGLLHSKFGAVEGHISAATGAIVADDTLKLQRSVNPSYATGPASGFLVSPAAESQLWYETVGSGTNKRPLWERGPGGGAPPTLNGRPYWTVPELGGTSEHIGDNFADHDGITLAANERHMVFGDLSTFHEHIYAGPIDSGRESVTGLEGAAFLLKRWNEKYDPKIGFELSIYNRSFPLFPGRKATDTASPTRNLTPCKFLRQNNGAELAFVESSPVPVVVTPSGGSAEVSVNVVDPVTGTEVDPGGSAGGDETPAGSQAEIPTSPPKQPAKRGRAKKEDS